MERIPVDLELHKAIEIRRLSFEESQLDIIRRVFGIRHSRMVSSDDESVDIIPRTRRTRRGGDYRFEVLGEDKVAHSLKEALREIILTLESKKAGTIDKISQYRTPKGRRIVARKPVELYPGKQNLAESYAGMLSNGWWFDTNISKKQFESYIKSIVHWCGFSENDIKLRF